MWLWPRNHFVVGADVHTLVRMAEHEHAPQPPWRYRATGVTFGQWPDEDEGE